MKNITVCRECLLQQGRSWVEGEERVQENNLDVNIHGSGLDSMYCSMVFLGNVNLPLTVVVLIKWFTDKHCIYLDMPRSPQLDSESILRITPKLGFCLVPSLVLGGEERNLLGYLFL